MASQADAERAVQNGEVGSEAEFWQRQAEDSGADFSKLREKEKRLAKERQRVERLRQEALEVWNQWCDLLKQRDRVRNQIANAKANRAELEHFISIAPAPHLDDKIGQAPGAFARRDLTKLGSEIASWREALTLIDKFLERKADELKQAEKAVEAHAKKHGFVESKPESEPEPEPVAEAGEAAE